MRTRLLLPVWLMVMSHCALAQYDYSLNYQTNTINVASNWVGTMYIVGNSTYLNALVINSGGVLSEGYGFVGYSSGGSNNAVIVNGGIWNNSDDVSIGFGDSGNSLVISNHGTAFFNDLSYVGYTSSSKSNRVLVTGSGSVWSNSASLYLGLYGSGNNLVISEGGVVFNGAGRVAYDSLSKNNSVLVTGSGSIWSNRSLLFIGETGNGNTLVISNQGAVFSVTGGAVGEFGSTNRAVVTGAGSVWSCGDLFIGEGGVDNSLTITAAGTVYSRQGYICSGGNGHSVLVADGGRWQNSSTLYVGYSGSSNALTIAGGSVVASNAFIGYFFLSSGSNNVLRVDSGSLFVTNAAGSGALVVSRASGKGELILNGGSVTVDGLIAINGVNSVITFNGGTLHSKGTAVTNTQPFVVGGGTMAATFHLMGGVHSFNNGLRIRNNAMLTGCGTINGLVAVDPGGVMLADCGGTLTFTGSVTNNGMMFAKNGSVLEAYGIVVNNGVINFIEGATDFHGTLLNNGLVLDANGDADGDGQSNLAETLAGTDPTNSASFFGVTGVATEGVDLRVTWATTTGKTNALERSASVGTNYAGIFAVTNATGIVTNYLDLGAATNAPAWFYRVRLVP
jgi:T5SS/PEP-CTERM-associated repeat protein